jgi:hypothetical protein
MQLSNFRASNSAVSKADTIVELCSVGTRIVFICVRSPTIFGRAGDGQPLPIAPAPWLGSHCPLVILPRRPVPDKL